MTADLSPTVPAPAAPIDPVLPRMVRFEPHRPLLRRAADSVQFGLLPGNAVEVAGLPPPLLRLLVELVGCWRVDELVARAVELGADARDTCALLADLHAAGVLVDGGLHARRADARRSASILVSGQGPLVAGVAGALAAAGVGRLHVMSDGVVEAGEVGCFTSADLGAPRAEAAARAVERVAPGVRVRTCMPRRPPDLAVLVDLLRPDPRRHPVLVSREVPRLIVQVADGVGLVGPLVLPKRSACPRCIDLRRAGVDPCWPAVAAGLEGKVGTASPATTLATAALAAEQAVLVLDSFVAAGEPPPTLDAVLELDARRGTLRQRRWAPHPECGCGAAHTRRGSADIVAPTSGGAERAGGAGEIEPRAACEVMPGR